MPTASELGELRKPELVEPRITRLDSDASHLKLQARGLQECVEALCARLFGSHSVAEKATETPPATGIVGSIERSIEITNSIIQDVTSQVQYILDQTTEPPQS